MEFREVTAQLTVSDVELNAADIESGELPSGSVEVRSVPWLWYRYHASPGLLHSRPLETKATEIGRIVEDWYARCIAIISPAGIEAFLSQEFD